MIEEVKRSDVDAISRATIFVASESFGIWHNRARANLCRFFKNHPPSNDECKRMVDAIVNRLIDGRFSQQFKDQLSMAIRFAPERMAAAADIASRSEREYVGRYARWVRRILNSSENAGTGESYNCARDVIDPQF